MSRVARDPLRRRSRQRGAALLTAMIIVTLIATLAASMVWQQWRAIQVEAAERSRSQSAWILSGALDWARLILKEDAKTRGATKLGEPWATPLMEARLSTFLAADKSTADDGPEAFLAGAISDAQARYNLTNLVVQGKVDPAELAALQRLCDTTLAASGLASRIATGLAAAQGAVGTEAAAQAVLLPRSVAQLTWLGIDAEALRALSPYVVLLPRQTPVNVNTASREVLVGAIKDLDLATAERLIQRRPFNSLPEVQRELPTLALDPAKVNVTSSFFEVRGRFRLADRVLEQISLVERSGNNVNVLHRENIASRDQPGS